MNYFKTSILDKFESLIDEIIPEINDSYTDEILCDMMQDQTYRQEALDWLLDLLIEYYEIKGE